MIEKTKRYRSEKYLNFIRSKRCLICDRLAEPHHVKINHNSGMGRKPDDTYSIPLCRDHHEEIEKLNTVSFCDKYVIDIYNELFLLVKEFLEKT